MHDTLRLLSKKLSDFSIRACQRLVGHPISSVLNTSSLQHASPARDAQMKVSRVVWNTKTRHACGVLAGAAASPCGYTRALCSRHLLPWPPVRNLWGTESRVGLLRRANLFIRREPRRPSRKKTASLLSDAQRPCVRQRYILVAATHYANTI